MTKVKITEDIKYVGVNDHKLDLFEGQYIVPKGMAYNSYVIVDEKIAVMDTVDRKFADEWLQNIKKILEGRKPTYLVLSHMEPDHSACIGAFVSKYPDIILVGNAKTFTMLEQFYRISDSVSRMVVADRETLELGKHKLTFVFAPMVHWPEVMVSYDSTDKVLFSADGFGKFGAVDIEDEWECEARRYYFGIVGKYGTMVQKLLAVASTLDIQIICPLHGSVLSENIGHYLSLYDTWSSYRAEAKGIMIAYASIYGHTRAAAELLKQKLEQNGCDTIVVADLAREDMAECVENAFRYDRLVLASVTYNGDIFPFMKTFINNLVERGYQNRKIAFIENGTWAPNAAKVMKEMFTGCRNIAFADETVKIKSALSAVSEASIEKLAVELMLE